MKPKVIYLSRNTTDHTITLAINGQRYEYWLNPGACDSVEYLCKHVSSLKALALAKRLASRTERL
jgi:hypothetical protein